MNYEYSYDDSSYHWLPATLYSGIHSKSSSWIKHPSHCIYHKTWCVFICIKSFKMKLSFKQWKLSENEMLSALCWLIVIYYPRSSASDYINLFLDKIIMKMRSFAKERDERKGNIIMMRNGIDDGNHGTISSTEYAQRCSVMKSRFCYLSLCVCVCAFSSPYFTVIEWLIVIH